MAPHFLDSIPRKRERQAAPGELELIREFLNTADREAGTDLFTNPLQLAHWAVKKGLLPAETQLTEDDLQRTVGLREGLWAVVAGKVGPKRRDALERFTAEALLQVCFNADGSLYLQPAASGLGAVHARLVLALVMASDDQRRRFKLCARADCAAAFYDYSPNRSARWCQPRCGELLNTRAGRRRQRRTRRRR